MDKIRIYLSYSHFDKELAQKFYNYLSEQDFEVVWDKNTIITGDNFSKKLMGALVESDIYLPIISKNFEESYFTNRELLTAIGSNASKESPRIFPYIVYGNDIPSDISTLLCFMGSENIDDDLIKIGNSLHQLRGSIVADKIKNKGINENLNVSLEDYLKDVFEKLEKNEKINKKLAYFSYVLSSLFLLAIVIFGVIRFFSHNFSNVDLLSNIFITLQGVIIITVLAALSRLSFILGKSFMVESIRNGDRIHAISFGKFYIRAYGKEANRYEIREVLGEWNIDKGSSFHTQDAKEIDPNILGVLELLKAQKTK